MMTSTIKQQAYRVLFSLLYRSRWVLLIAILASIINGIANVFLISLINRIVTTSGDSYRSLAGYFCVLAITHDDRFFHLADHCIKLENGHLTGQGSPLTVN